MRIQLIKPVALTVFMLGMTGCAPTVRSVDAPVTMAKKGQGVYHTVQRGQTLWRIAQNYQVSIDEIIRINKIPDAARLEEGQLLFIPGVSEVKAVPAKKTDPDKKEFAWPVKGQVVHYFNQHKQGLSHKGIAIKVPPGEPVKASREGRVVFADYLCGYTYTLILDHLDGFHSVYSLNSKMLVKVGDYVFKGDQIALAGSQGRETLLYFEIRKKGQANNPLYYLPR